MIDIRDVADSALGALTGKAEQGKEYMSNSCATRGLKRIDEGYGIP